MTAPSPLRAALSELAAATFETLLAEVTADPAAIRRHFPAAARRVGRGPLPGAVDASGAPARIEDAVRGELLAAHAAAVPPERLAADVTDLYGVGDADEKRAVLAALDRLPLGSEALPLVADALRTNDTRLVAAALGPYGTRHLDDDAWRQGVLKCLFVGVPLAAVDGLPQRADARLGTMVAAYANERLAAGRAVPDDALALLADFPEEVAAAGLADRLAQP
ncbi:EboA domain-containing protein [Georgenia faecalis]|uniref:EboA domain-containing protein n=1 Tax=Georgenia faecalis TaxID=2483799 RepID=A0ABV9D5F5_9MICO|nr:EboA domain-containing protein [Georgenia faecalis]